MFCQHHKNTEERTPQLHSTKSPAWQKKNPVSALDICAVVFFRFGRLAAECSLSAGAFSPALQRPTGLSAAYAFMQTSPQLSSCCPRLATSTHAVCTQRPAVTVHFALRLRRALAYAQAHMCTHIYMCVYAYVHVYVCTCMYMCVYVCMCKHIYAHIPTSAHVCSILQGKTKNLPSQHSQ